MDTFNFVLGVLVFVVIFTITWAIKRGKNERKAEKEKETPRSSYTSVTVNSNAKKDDVLTRHPVNSSGSDADRKKAETLENRINRLKNQLASVQYAIEQYEAPGDLDAAAKIVDDKGAFQVIAPVDLRSLDMSDLKKKYKENEKEIASLFKTYASKYTTKTNTALYKLMVLALEAELQNILHTIKYGKLEDCIVRIRELTGKYYSIATDGNQSIAPSIQKFIARLEYFYIEAVKIEYEYYVKKEQQKEEQKAIREQARQEAADRKANEAMQKKLEDEAQKYDIEIKRLSDAMESADRESEEYVTLKQQMDKIVSLKEEIAEKQEELAELQNGKAGTVYVISNIGAFGENVFKVGMTRRLVPQDRIDELSSASVPFPFDVHSMIFSKDAPALETKLHRRLADMRINKVNMHKEFFRVSLDEIEQIVHEEDPTAEFHRTALAEQYNQSMSIN